MLGEFVQSPRTIHNTTLARHMTTVLANPVRPSTRVAFAMAGFSLLAYLPARTRAAGCSNRCFSHRPAKMCKQRIQLPMRRQQHGMSAAEVRQHRTGLTSHCYKLRAQTVSLQHVRGRVRFACYSFGRVDAPGSSHEVGLLVNCHFIVGSVRCRSIKV